MQNKAKKPFITVKEAIIAAIILWFTAIAFEKVEINQVPTRGVIEAEVRLFAKQLPVLSVSQIVEKLESGHNKPTLMVIYASWCGVCKKVLPRIYALKKEGSLENINLLFISVDEDKEALSRYVMQHNYTWLFEPYVIEKGGAHNLMNMLALRGLDFKLAVPYLAMFDSEGKAITTIRHGGGATKSFLLENIQKAVN